MDIVTPLVKLGLISETANLWLAVPIGFIFGFALFHAGFTDSRRIAWAFYFKDMGVPVVMFSAIITGMLGLWGLSLAGVLDISQVYLLPSYVIPMAVGGLIFGMGMVIGGFCPGTAIAAIATGKIDGVIFVVGFLLGSLFFGDFFPVWGDFYNSDYQGVFRLDQLFGMEMGLMLFVVVVGATLGALGMIGVQKLAWPTTKPDPQITPFRKLQAGLIAAAMGIGLIFAFFPTSAFIDDSVEPGWYIVPRAAVEQPVAPPPVAVEAVVEEPLS
jgi:uncharacterized protein